jgi:hypothetical protein
MNFQGPDAMLKHAMKAAKSGHLALSTLLPVQRTFPNLN